MERRLRALDLEGYQFSGFFGGLLGDWSHVVYPYGSFRKLGVPYLGVLIIRILRLRGLY